jgi:hypothetical protein
LLVHTAYIYIHNYIILYYIDFWRINGSIVSAKPQDKLKQDKFRATATPLWWGDVEKLEIPTSIETWIVIQPSSD